MNAVVANLFGPRFLLRGASLLVVVALFSGCSIKKLAINKLGDALSGSGSTFASDDDPELVNLLGERGIPIRPLSVPGRHILLSA